MKIDLELEKETNTLSFIFGDKTDDYNYIYNYTLNNVFNINTLCIFFHNRNCLKIKKSDNNYLVIEKDFIEIKTNNSYVNQKCDVNINKFHYELLNLLYRNGYISYSINFIPSEEVKRNHKIKKNNIRENDLQCAKSNLSAHINKKKLNISENDLKNKIGSLKKVHPIIYHPPHITDDILKKQKLLLKHSEIGSPNKLILEEISDSNCCNDELIDSVLDYIVDTKHNDTQEKETSLNNYSLYDTISISSEETIECDNISSDSDMEIEPLF